MYHKIANKGHGHMKDGLKCIGFIVAISLLLTGCVATDPPAPFTGQYIPVELTTLASGMFIDDYKGKWISLEGRFGIINEKGLGGYDRSKYLYFTVQAPKVGQSSQGVTAVAPKHVATRVLGLSFGDAIKVCGQAKVLRRTSGTTGEVYRVLYIEVKEIEIK